MILEQVKLKSKEIAGCKQNSVCEVYWSSKFELKICAPLEVKGKKKYEFNLVSSQIQAADSGFPGKE